MASDVSRTLEGPVSAVDEEMTLAFSLAGVLSWSRPRPGRGAVRYEGPYAAGRDGWALLARAAVTAAGWAPPDDARYRVDIVVHGGGLKDLDRVITAVCDACQAGGAIRNDCLVDLICADRVPVGKGEASSTDVTVALVLPPGKRTKG